MIARQNQAAISANSIKQPVLGAQNNSRVGVISFGIKPSPKKLAAAARKLERKAEQAARDTFDKKNIELTDENKALQAEIDRMKEEAQELARKNVKHEAYLKEKGVPDVLKRDPVTPEEAAEKARLETYNAVMDSDKAKKRRKLLVYASPTSLLTGPLGVACTTVAGAEPLTLALGVATMLLAGGFLIDASATAIVAYRKASKAAKFAAKNFKKLK